MSRTIYVTIVCQLLQLCNGAFCSLLYNSFTLTVYPLTTHAKSLIYSDLQKSDNLLTEMPIQALYRVSLW